MAFLLYMTGEFFVLAMIFEYCAGRTPSATPTCELKLITRLISPDSYMWGGNPSSDECNNFGTPYK